VSYVLESEVSLPPGLKWDYGMVFNSETMAVSAQVSEKYLVETSDIEENPLEVSLDLSELPIRFPVMGIRSQSTNRLIAYVSLSQVTMDVCAPTLPENGWQALVRSSYSNGKATGMALWVAIVLPEYRKLKLSDCLLKQSLRLTKQRGFHTLIGPVRPSRKAEFPDLSFEEYIEMKTSDGRIFDPWLRLHLQNGAEIVNICDSSTIVRASLGQWEKWTGLKFQQSGSHRIPGGIVPLQVDLSARLGVYKEPGIWVRYHLSGNSNVTSVS
jgi:hypothetical protein